MQRLLSFFFFALFSCFVFSLSSKEYVVGNLNGQLGNQLFIIAATSSFAWDHEAIPLFPDLLHKKEENIPLNYEKIFFRLNTNRSPKPFSSCYNETEFSFQLIPFTGSMSLTGWFQTEKYFKKHKDKILALFKPSSSILIYLKKNYANILSHPKTVAIHFRDYSYEDPLHLTYPLCDKEYYLKAMELFPKDSLFVVFSNNIAWCKETFADVERSFYFVENEPHYHDIYLMSLCKDAIIANSSYSWWGAYLNKNPHKKVVAPLKWFTEEFMVRDKKDIKDILPEEWIKI